MVDLLELPPEPMRIDRVPEGAFVAGPENQQGQTRLERLLAHAKANYPDLHAAMLEYQRLEAKIIGLEPTQDLLAPLARQADKIRELSKGATLPPDLKACEPCEAGKR